MHIFKRRSFNYANITATLALLFAMSGGALAANHYLISSTKQISPKVLGKLKGARGATGLTGASGKEGAAGKEGPQGKEGAAGKEGPQGKEGAPGKEGAAGKEGAIVGMQRWRTTLATAGPSEAEATTVVLATSGPFTVTGHCYVTGANTVSGTYVSSSEEGAQGESYEGNLNSPLPKGEEQPASPLASGSTSEHKADFSGPNDGSWALESADGSVSLNGFTNQGVWLQGESGPACSFSGYVVVE